MLYLSRVIFERLLCGGTQERRSHNHALLYSDEQAVLFKTGQEKGGLERRGPPCQTSQSCEKKLQEGANHLGVSGRVGPLAGSSVCRLRKKEVSFSPSGL